MRWNTAWSRNNRREIHRSFGRYFAMLIIVALGVGFFSGLKVTRSAIVQTGDHYIDQYNLYDYRLISTLGLTEDDVQAMEETDGIQEAEGSVSADFLATQPDGTEVVLKAYSVTEIINQVHMLAGRMPQQPNECVADRRGYTEADIGKTIRVSENNDADTAEQFAYTEYTIVGLVDSVLYLNNERGTSQLAGGSIYAFVMIPRDGFDVDYLTELYVTVENRGGIFTQEYEQAIQDAQPSVEEMLETRAEMRYDDILQEVNDKIQEGQEEYDQGFAEYLSEKTDAEQQLSDARRELDSAARELADGEQQLSENQQKIDDGFSAYQDGMAEYSSGKTQLNAQKKQAYAQLDAAQKQLDTNRVQVQDGIEQIKASGVLEQYEQLQAAIPQLQDALAQIDAAEPQREQLEQQLGQVQEGLQQIEESGILEQYEQLLQSAAQLEQAIAQAEEARAQQPELLEQLAQIQEGMRQIEESGILERYAQLNTEIDMLETQLAQTEDESLQESLKEQLEPLYVQRQQVEESGVLEQYEALLQSELQLETALEQIPSEQQIQEWNAQLEQAKVGIEQIEQSGVPAQYQQLRETEEQLTAALEQFEQTERELREQLTAALEGKQQIEQSGVLLQYEQLTEALQQIREGQTELDIQRMQAEREFSTADAVLQQAKTTLENSLIQLKQAQQELDRGKVSLTRARQQYRDGLQEYEDSRLEAEQAFAEAEQELAEALGQLEDARAERDEIEPAETYALDRTTNTGYVCFENDSAIVEGIARVFPVFFFLVAALVCMTTMTRMVDEQRTQIGTFKALGYSDRDIMSKYIGYSGSAAVIGAVIGFLLGCKLFPYALWKAYNMMYDFAEIEFVLDGQLALLSLAVALLCSAGATIVACRAELMRMPSELMRPKAPAPGKRVFLERITPLWARMSFLHKVTVRNIFRYKKRLFMMVLGIGGCTALVLTGFGVKDSIANIAEDQYGAIMQFDYEITFSDPQSRNEQEQFLEDTKGMLSSSVFVYRTSVDVVGKDGIQQVNVVASDDTQITQLIDFHLNGNSVPYPKDGEVLVNEKLAELAGVSVGDMISVQIDETHIRQVKVGGIYENYVYHYLFMTKSTCEQLLGEACEYQNAYACAAGEDVHNTAAVLARDYEISAVSVVQDTKNMVANMMLSLNYIVWLVIACAGVLAFVVLFNLSNINLTERVREIATIKVLGFFPKETGAYVFRENIVLTALGALAGLPMGIALHRFVMDQIQVDMVSFQVRIFPISFVLSLGVTFLFALLVDLVMRRKLEHINMAESLKSVE